MTLPELKQELIEHLARLNIPRTIEPNHGPVYNGAASVSQNLWEEDPLRILNQLKEWLNMITQSHDLVEYHSISFEQYGERLRVNVSVF
jgi:hypothetical protein